MSSMNTHNDTSTRSEQLTRRELLKQAARVTTAMTAAGISSAAAPAGHVPAKQKVRVPLGFRITTTAKSM